MSVPGANHWRTLARAVTLSALGTGLLICPGQAVQAHEFRSALVRLDERAPGLFAVSFTRDVGPGTSALAVALPGACQLIGVPAERVSGPVRVTFSTASCGRQGLRGANIGVTNLSASARSAFIEVNFLDGTRFRTVLDGTSETAHVPPLGGAHDPDQGRNIAWPFIRLGVWHIASGADHLLFVLALLLLVGARARPLVATVTAFTIGHSLTLTLATLGAAAPSPAPVEALIALSIAWLALELTRPPAHTTTLSAYPWLAALAFGLLHGFGFAGALSEAGLPAEELPLALLCFNVGVELGQLAFIGLCLALYVGARRTCPRLVRAIRPWMSAYALGGLACFFAVDRVATLATGG